MRKCWRLVARGEESAAPATASRSAAHERRAPEPAPEIVPQGDIEDETEAAPPPARTAAAPPKPAAAQTRFVQAPPADNWPTRDVSSASEAPLPLPPPAPSADPTRRAESAGAPLRGAQTAEAESAPLVITEQSDAQPPPSPKREKSVKTAQAEGTSILGWLPLTLALLALGCGAIFYVARVMRQRSDVLAVMQHADNDAREAAPSPATVIDEPTFAPLPPIGAGTREDDDVDEALRRFAESWKRRAA